MLPATLPPSRPAALLGISLLGLPVGLLGVRGKVNADPGTSGGLGRANYESADLGARNEFFHLRVWTADDLTDQIRKNYDCLP